MRMKQLHINFGTPCITGPSENAQMEQKMDPLLSMKKNAGSGRKNTGHKYKLRPTAPTVTTKE